MTVESDGDRKRPLRLGGNQVSLRQYNERVVLSLVRESGALSKADIARITRLSSQTVTVIVNHLLAENFLRKKEVIRGRIGQPSTPVEINPDRALSVGIKIGRRSLDLLALSFDRRIVARRSCSYPRLDGEIVLALLPTAFAALASDLTPEQVDNLIGVGIAAPTAIAEGEAVIGDPGGFAPRWREADLIRCVETVSGLQVTVLNDATAACLAELESSPEGASRSMIYFYVSTLIGGGIVVDGKLIAGRTGNAGAVGSLPMGLAQGNRRPLQLIETTSLNRLEKIARIRGLAMSLFQQDGPAAADPTPAVFSAFDAWCDEAANALAFSGISGASFFEAEEIVIDGVLTRALMVRLIATVKARLADYNSQGLMMPAVRVGRIGFDARAIGAALVPLNKRFLPNDRIFLKI